MLIRVIALSALLLSATFAIAQEKTVNKVPMTPTSATSGPQMYKHYCAACHGSTGKGDGPAAEALKVPPADLTVLAKKNGGKFPSERVISVLRFGATEPAHGAKEMPVWGPLFASSNLEGQAPGVVDLRISNLTKYIESIQAK
ncbi:MAG TPA: c-type cytochrome [Terriglobales bacterium]|nr:c-type cytochrome [Terriglobales bacterium]